MLMRQFLQDTIGGIIIIVLALHPASQLSSIGRGSTGMEETSAYHLWVDAANGNNSNNGLSAETALRTIQYAADLAQPGTTVHILPGVYRESITPAESGQPDLVIRYVAEEGRGTVVIRGSEPSSSLVWSQLTLNTIQLPPGVDPKNIYYTDISAWGLSEPPRFVVELDHSGEVVARMPLAREPDWAVTTDWKYHEFWWAADGGKSAASCLPPIDTDPLDCDEPSRSLTQLTDLTDDTNPPGIEPGNLTTLENLIGGTVVVVDTNTGHFTFRRKITAHDVPAGRITVGDKCEQGHGTDRPGLGWGSKYYIEDLPQLLDSPGEWWYERRTGRLYLWPRNTGNPSSMSIEISRRSDAFDLHNLSHITLDGLTIEFFSGIAISTVNTSYDKSHHNSVQNILLRYSNMGVWLSQYVDPNAPDDMSIDGFTIEDSEIAYMDTEAIHTYSSWKGSPSTKSFTRPGVTNVVVRRNEMHHLGYRTDYEDGVGIEFIFADHLRFEDNHIHHIAHNGVQFIRSVVQSTKRYGFSPEEIKTGDILIRNNIIEKACQNNADCGALKISGTPPDRHVFRDLLITGNVIRDTFGWTYIAEQRGHFDGGDRSLQQGMGGFGLYVDNASGVIAFRNIAYNNAFAGFKFAASWRDGDILLYNNTIANSFNGFHFGGESYDTHGSYNTQLINNIVVNSEGYGIFLGDADGELANFNTDHTLYFNNGWRPYEEGGLQNPGNLVIAAPVSNPYFPTLADIQAGTPWESHGIEGDPAFRSYDINDHDPYDHSWPNFHLTSSSTNAMNHGTTDLPETIKLLLKKLGVLDIQLGTAYDIGRYETGFLIRPNPIANAIERGGTTQFQINLHPSDVQFPVTVQAFSPSPNLLVSLDNNFVTPTSPSTLTVTDIQAESSNTPGLWYSIEINGEGEDFRDETQVYLLVNGERFYFPAVIRK